MPFFPVRNREMKMQTLVKRLLFCVCIFLFCCVPILYQKQPIPSRELRAKKIGIRKRETVTIVKEKAVALQQFFLQNWDPWYSLSFLWERDDLTVTNLAEKLKKYGNVCSAEIPKTTDPVKENAEGMHVHKCNAFGKKDVVAQ